MASFIFRHFCLLFVTSLYLLFHRISPLIPAIFVLWVAAVVCLSFGLYITLYAGFRISPVANAEANFAGLCLIFKFLILNLPIAEDYAWTKTVAIFMCLMSAIFLVQPHNIAEKLSKNNNYTINKYDFNHGIYYKTELWPLWTELENPPKTLACMFVASLLYVLYIFITRTHLKELPAMLILFWISLSCFIISAVFAPLIEDEEGIHYTHPHTLHGH